MRDYADASFLVSLYMPDAHSATAIAQMIAGELALVSTLAVVETINAIRLREFRKERTPEQVAESIDAFESDIESGVLRFAGAPSTAWDVARKLSRQHTAQLGTRSLDILQVAAALVLKADNFLTFDRTQAVLAKAEGLETPLQG